jgi:hypothetical protein
MQIPLLAAHPLFFINIGTQAKMSKKDGAPPKRSARALRSYDLIIATYLVLGMVELRTVYHIMDGM